MNLDQAIKKIINDHGADILKERRLVSMLSDLLAFGQLPYAANMLRQIYDNGYGVKIYQLYCNKDKSETDALLNTLRNKLGFDVEMLGKVLYAFSLPVSKGHKQKQNTQNISVPRQKTNQNNDLEVIMYDGRKAYKDEYGGIYSFPNAEVFYKFADDKVSYYVLRENTKIIYENAFCERKSLIEIIIPNSAKSIGGCAFLDCSSLRQVTIPDSVTSIGKSAFAKCSSLRQVTIPNSVISVEDGTFSECSSLLTIKIPNFVTSIDKSAFAECSSLQQVTIPDSVTSIEESAFYRCYSLQQVNIPDSVKNIGESAFYKCYSLQRITIPNSVTNIGKNAFAECSSLRQVTIPNSVIMIEDGAFSKCTSLQTIEIPNSVTTIGQNAFAECSSLLQATIPESVTTFGTNVFFSCNNLGKIYSSLLGKIRILRSPWNYYMFNDFMGRNLLGIPQKCVIY